MDTYIIMNVAVIVLLLALSGFFSGSETALTAASKARLHNFEKDGQKGARAAMDLINDREKLISALLLGNNLVNILASALATAFLLKIFGEYGVAYATIAMTLLVLIFSEVLPKTYAITRPNRASMAVSGPVSIFVKIFYPVSGAVQLLVSVMLRAMGVRDVGTMSSPHDEIRGTVDMHHQEGGMAKGDRDQLIGVLELRDLTVDDVMIHRKSLSMIDGHLPVQEIVEQALESPHTRLPIWKDDPDNVVGVLHAKDLLRALHGTGGDMSKLDVKSIWREPWFVPETTPLAYQLRAFQKRRAHFALAVDEYGALMGVITLEDILEEIVGDIIDEHDVPIQGARPQPDGTYIINGDVPIRDINRAFEWELPDEEAVTLAGLIIHEAQTLPDPGQTFSFYGFRFEVLRRQRNQITAIHVVPPGDETDDESEDG